MGSSTRFLPFYILLVILIQSALMYLLIQDVKALVLSLLFTVGIIGLAIFIWYQSSAEYQIKEKQLRDDLSQSNKEVRRLQKFNKANITTIRKLKVYSKSAMERLKSGNIDF